jgi:hypothetical protein
MTFRPLVWTPLVKEKDGHMWGLTGLFNKHQSPSQTNLSPTLPSIIQSHRCGTSNTMHHQQQKAMNLQ